MVCPLNGCPTRAVDAPTIIEKADRSVWNEIPRFLVESADILLQVAKQENRQNASQMVDLLADISFAMNIFRQKVKSLADWGDCRTWSTRALMKNDVLHWVSVRGNDAKKDSCSTLYRKDVADALQKLVKYFGKDYIMFCTEWGDNLRRAASLNMTPDYIWTSYEKLKNEVTKTCESGSVWLEKNDRSAKSFVDFLNYVLTG